MSGGLRVHSSESNQLSLTSPLNQTLHVAKSTILSTFSRSQIFSTIPFIIIITLQLTLCSYWQQNSLIFGTIIAIKFSIINTTIKIEKSREGVMWWRTRDTRATCHNSVTAIKMEHFLQYSCFLDPNRFSSGFSVDWIKFGLRLTSKVSWFLKSQTLIRKQKIFFSKMF